ncbi:hypothetical protein L228DRAFT_270711 [Xylona heveae TC161]|uniref:A-kinase anchor protein 7-like phosphoesterase domain-containing protein n=1 Tax=Xylona heveae (strain CBS 132557 / TC161) TaxID=1328760 RepID=A0A165A4M9_XYLHT|nr:hypothetical protein L228DRAFT_270711 [Xylona heveae TC161]KZF19944.1 hypothetical protein L228DRAFT_270711 [Xylona heveae TC161]
MPPKPPLTHFLCLPLVTNASRSQLQASVEAFAAESQGTHPESVSIPQRAFRPLETLHLTLGVMSLLEPGQVESAIKLLHGLDMPKMLRDASSDTMEKEEPIEIAQPITGEEQSDNGAETKPAGTVEVKSTSEGHPQSSQSGDSHMSGLNCPLNISLRSLVSMHDPKKTSILYAQPVDASDRLLPFCRQLKEKFVEAGFLVPDTRPLLLHATMLNTVYVPAVRQKTTGDRGHGKRKAKLTVDATKLLEKYKDFSWADDFKLEEVAICEMGAKRIVNEQGDVIGEKYEQIASKNL